MSRFIPLSIQRFNTLSWSRFADYHHAETLPLVPLAAPELARAACHLPLTFARDAQNRVGLFVLTGLRAGVNHCLNPAGQWEAGYIPAFLRTYPFRLLPPPTGQGNTETQRVVCVDIESPRVGAHGEYPFFVEDRPNQATQDVIDFLGKMAKHYAHTDRAATLLHDLGLLTPWSPPTCNVTDQLHGLLRLDEAQLAKADPDTLYRLNQYGALALAYGQAMSTQQLFRLQELAEKNDPRHQPVDLQTLLGTNLDDLLKFH